MPNNTRLPREEILWKIFHSVRNSTPDQHLLKPTARELVLAMLADEYGIDASDITERGESTIYTVHSKLIRLLFPKSLRAQRNLNQAISEGISFNHALLIARGRYDTKEEIIAAKSEKHQEENVRGIPLADIFTAAISAARGNGYDAEQIQTAFHDAFDGYEADNS